LVVATRYVVGCIAYAISICVITVIIIVVVAFLKSSVVPYDSGEEITRSHSWSNKRTYTIICKAKDIHDEESNWATLEVSMPKNHAMNQWIYWLLEQHPLLENLFYHYQNI